MRIKRFKFSLLLIARFSFGQEFVVQRSTQEEINEVYARLALKIKLTLVNPEVCGITFVL